MGLGYGPAHTTRSVRTDQTVRSNTRSKTASTASPKNRRSKKNPGRSRCRETGENVPNSYLHPLESALPEQPHVADNQNTQKNKHACQSVEGRHPKALLARREKHRPGKQKNGLDVENHEKNSNDVEPHRIAPPRIALGGNTALIRLQLRADVPRIRPDQLEK